MTQSNGKKLSMHGSAVYKGDFTHNGMLLKLHENAFTIGYSRLLTADGSATGATKFGNGVFFDLTKKNNNVYAGKPTGQDAVSSFAGIMVREPGIASGYPVLNDEVNGFQNGLLCRQGFVVYKKADVYYGTAGDYKGVEVFPFVYQNYCAFVAADDGQVYFTPKSTTFRNSDDIMVGRVVEINPDDQSVTVYVSPALLSDTASLTEAAPTMTAGTAKANSIPVKVTVGTPCTVKFSIKAGTGDFEDTDGTYTPVYDDGAKAYVLNYDFTGLAKGTDYTLRAIAISVGGAGSVTAEATTLGE